jgi:hypothetical protein
MSSIFKERKTLMIQLESSNTGNICVTLLSRLSEQGLMLVESRKLIRNVIDLLHKGGFFTLDSVNNHLQQTGWTRHCLDTETLELIISLIQTEYDYSVKTHVLH